MSVAGLGQDGRRLKSWKEIAAFFGCTERTVKRWEARGLPVRRLPNGSRSAVFAYENELRAWLDEDRARTEAASSVERAGDSVEGRWSLSRFAIAVGGMVGVAVVVGLLMLGLRPGSMSEAPADHRVSAEAQRFYLAGVYGWQSRTPAGLTQAVDNFTQAIVHDPQYAKAYAGLADCYNLLREYTAMPADYAFPRAKAAAERAIALDPSLADAHAALAFVDFYWSHDTATASREFETAIRLAPGNATARHWHATFLVDLKKFSEALAEIEKAQQLDPASGSILADKGAVLFYAGRTEEAISLLRQLEETQPHFSSPHLYLSAIGRIQGDDKQFVDELSAYAVSRHDAADRAIATAATRGLAQGGHKGMLLAMLPVQQRLLSQEQDSAYLLAQTYTQLGDASNAMRYLKLSFARHESAAMFLNTDPNLRTLRRLPAFQQLVQHAGVEADRS